MSITSIFIAGVMQGSTTDGSISDQSYRNRILDEVRRAFPDAECFDPAEPTTRLLDSLTGVPELPARLSAGLDTGCIEPSAISPQVAEISSTFMAATERATQCSLCIAYLPGRELSMGTAMEMYAAKAAGRPVITITTNTSNLAILATSDVLVSDLSHLHLALARLATTVGN